MVSAEDARNAGLSPNRNTVMTAHAVSPPSRPNRDADIRILDSASDWDAAVRVMEPNNTTFPAAEYRAFLQRYAASMRARRQAGTRSTTSARRRS
ncbi:hypothetical protein EEJ31_07715 [Cryobacterium tepidiphilum]|uniref:Uncharacterized protein n=1 Tax=Cryobacterium tepidiphilum TaxID=2486026 RepID=A0A3M8LAG1_9MICO|nr:hypothetical protein EEJ31_07715 [Cryobacterium tepidiphilum]